MNLENAIKKEMSRHGIDYISDSCSRILKEKARIPKDCELFAIGSNSLFCLYGDVVYEWTNKPIKKWNSVREWAEAHEISFKNIRKEAASEEGKHYRFS